MFRFLTCAGALISTLAFSNGTTQAQVKVEIFHAPPGIPQDWAKYGAQDMRKDGYEYYGRGMWMQGFRITGAQFSGTTLTGPYVMGWFIPFYYAPEPPSRWNSPGNEPRMDWVHAPRVEERAPLTKPKARPDADKDKRRAVSLMAAGDTSFGERHYPAAADRYKSAIAAAPELADAHFRLGFAHLAQNRYARAGKAFRRGLEFRRDWNSSTLQLDTLFPEGELEKATQALTKAVEADPNNAELAMLFGMQLFFSGQREKAAMYFSRAALSGGNEGGMLDDFMAGNQLAEAQGKDR